MSGIKRSATEEMKNFSTPTSLPATSLIIPSCNRPDLLLKAVESILQGDELPTELIIIDQSNTLHPTLSTRITDRACEIRYLWTKSVGASRARNAGIAAAQHDILVFVDDDVMVTPAWFGSLTRALLKAGAKDVVTGQVRPAEAEMPDGFAPSTKVSESPAVYVGRVGTDVLYTNNMAILRSTIDDVGDFDIRLGPGAPFSNAEDNDLGFRLLEAGYRIVYVPEAVVYHRAWRSKRDYLPLRWSYGRGQGAYYAKHLSLRDHYMLRRMVRHIGRYVLGFPRRLWGQRHLAYGDVVFVLGLLSGASEWLLTQRKIQ
jgi:GT2 family glycosyltransferase